MGTRTWGKIVEEANKHVPEGPKRSFVEDEDDWIETVYDLIQDDPESD